MAAISTPLAGRDSCAGLGAADEAKLAVNLLSAVYATPAEGVPLFLAAC